MTRDIFTISVTGAGLEWQFNKSDRIDTWPEIEWTQVLYESMKFNDYLRRNETSLILDKKRRLLSELIHSITRNDDEDQDENFDTDNNKIEILKWEKE